MLASARHSQGTRAQPSNSSALGKSRGSPRILLYSQELVPSPAGRAKQKTELGQAPVKAADDREAGAGALPSLWGGPCGLRRDLRNGSLEGGEMKGEEAQTALWVSVG